MKQALCSVMIFIIACVAFAADEGKGVEGNWVPKSAELGGKPMPDAVLKTIRLNLVADENSPVKGRYFVLVGDSPDNGTYKLDLESKPLGMTIVGTDGPNRGKTFPAIYELGKDDGGKTLRICYDLSGAKRPTEFKTTAGTKLYLVTYGRKKE